MRTIDYNGSGRWSRESLLARYIDYTSRYKVTSPRDLTPKQHKSGDILWVYPVMEQVIAGIAADDEACKWIGIEFVEEDARFPFGKILKANTAGALRKIALSVEQQERLRRRFSTMLLHGQVPREYKEYAKLLKRIGLGEMRQHLDAGINKENPYVMRFYKYLSDA